MSRSSSAPPPSAAPSDTDSAHVGATTAAPRPGLVSYDLAWLLRHLVALHKLTPEQERDLLVEAPRRRARLIRDHEGQAALVDAALGGDASNRRSPRGQGRYRPSPAEVLASFGLTSSDGTPLDEDQLARMLAAAAGVAYVKIDPLKLDMALVTGTLSFPYALRHVVLPMSQTEHDLLVAVDNPFDAELFEGLRRLSQRAVRIVVSSRTDIIKCIIDIYGFQESVTSAAEQSHAQGQVVEVSGEFEQLVQLRAAGNVEPSERPIVNAVDFLLGYAFEQRASDIHIEPRAGDTQVRLRIDGVLHDVHTIPRRVHRAVVSRIKMMARLDIAERRRPQDGRIKTALSHGPSHEPTTSASTGISTTPGNSSVMDNGDEPRTVELRVSTLPMSFGEKVVIRIFDPDVLLQGLCDLGFEPDQLAMFERWSRLPHGLILLTGPTGSGKTTTLYSTLRELASERINVTTVEDPVEMLTDRFNQVALHPKIGVDFPTALRSILRQDPDVIMIGEIRDRPTAEIAIQAALTGHLVFSTLHTNDTPSAVTRMMELQVLPHLLGSALVGVMAQRLVRRICAECAESHALTVDQCAMLGLAPDVVLPDAARGAGCVRCRHTGYFGRLGIFEQLDCTSAIGRLIGETGGDASALRAATGLQQGFRTLREAALARVARGETTPEEVARVTGMAIEVD